MPRRNYTPEMLQLPVHRAARSVQWLEHGEHGLRAGNGDRMESTFERLIGRPVMSLFLQDIAAYLMTESFSTLAPARAPHPPALSYIVHHEIKNVMNGTSPIRLPGYGGIIALAPHQAKDAFALIMKEAAVPREQTGRRIRVPHSNFRARLSRDKQRFRFEAYIGDAESPGRSGGFVLAGEKAAIHGLIAPSEHNKQRSGSPFHRIYLGELAIAGGAGLEAAQAEADGIVALFKRDMEAKTVLLGSVTLLRYQVDSNPTLLSGAGEGRLR